MTRIVELDYFRQGSTHRSVRGWKPAPKTPVQMLLFPVLSPNTIATIVLEREAVSFRDIVAALMPQIVFDLRVSPRFDFVGMNRKEAFSFFDERRVRYFDVVGNIGSELARDARINPDILGDYIRKRSPSVDTTPPCIALLIDDRYDDPEYISQLASRISPDIDAWNWMRVGTANDG